MLLAFQLSDIVTVPFGWLLNVLYELTTNYGVAVIIFAIIVKLVLTPMSAKGKKGFRVIHVQRPWWDGMKEWKQTENIQVMLERFFEVLVPERYKRLRMLSAEKGMESQLDLLDYLIDSHINDEVNGQYRREFEDAARAENGKELAYGERTKRTRTPSIYEQASLDFYVHDERSQQDAEHAEEEQQERQRNSEEARRWLEEHSEGEQPFGMEW